MIPATQVMNQCLDNLCIFTLFEFLHVTYYFSVVKKLKHDLLTCLCKCKSNQPLSIHVATFRILINYIQSNVIYLCIYFSSTSTTFYNISIYFINYPLKCWQKVERRVLSCPFFPRQTKFNMNDWSRKISTSWATETLVTISL